MSVLLLFGGYKVNSSWTKTIRSQAIMSFSKGWGQFGGFSVLCPPTEDVCDAGLIRAFISLLFRTGAGLSGRRPACVTRASPSRSDLLRALRSAQRIFTEHHRAAFSLPPWLADFRNQANWLKRRSRKTSELNRDCVWNI